MCLTQAGVASNKEDRAAEISLILLLEGALVKKTSPQALLRILPNLVMSASPWRSHSSEGKWVPQSCFGNVSLADAFIAFV